MKTNCIAIIVLLTGRFSALPQTLPHSLSGISPSSDGSMLLHLEGRTPTPFRSYFDLYPIDASPDLLNWTPLATLIRTNASTNALTYLDPDASTFSARYYRIPTNHLVTPLPQPTGPFAVGTAMRYFSDPTRTNRYNVKTNDTIVAQIWYPAQRQAGMLPRSYEDKPLAQDSNWNSSPQIAPLLVVNALPGAPVATNEARYPVILYSHGGTTVRTDNQGKMEELASHGFVTISADHFDSYGVVLANGRYVHGNAFSYLEDPRSAPLAFQNRIKDLTMLLDELVTMNDTDSVFANRLRLDHVGVVGHSFGGAAALEFARLEQRIAAAAYLDGSIFYWATNLIKFPVGKPVLLMNRHSSTTGFNGDSVTIFAKAVSDAYWLQIKGTEHANFMDYVWVESPYPFYRNASTAMRGCLASFFDKYLRNSDDHLLDNPTNTYPVVINFKRK